MAAGSTRRPAPAGCSHHHPIPLRRVELERACAKSVTAVSVPDQCLQRLGRAGYAGAVGALNEAARSRNRESGSDRLVQSFGSGGSAGSRPGTARSRGSRPSGPRTQESTWPWCSVRTTSVSGGPRGTNLAGSRAHGAGARRCDQELERLAGQSWRLIVGHMIGLPRGEQHGVDAGWRRPRKPLAVAEAPRITSRVAGCRQRPGPR